MYMLNPLQTASGLFAFILFVCDRLTSPPLVVFGTPSDISCAQLFHP